MDIKIQEIQEDVLQWERENEELLKRYSAVLKLLVEFVKAEKRKVQVVRIGDGPLQIREQVAGEEVSALSDDMRKRWASGNSEVLVVGQPNPSVSKP